MVEEKKRLRSRYDSRTAADQHLIAVHFKDSVQKYEPPSLLMYRTIIICLLMNDISGYQKR